MSSPSIRTPMGGLPTGKLPADPSSFVGRREELTQVRRRVTSGRLVTLTGTGGVGKTRLALRAAATCPILGRERRCRPLTWR